MPLADEREVLLESDFLLGVAGRLWRLSDAGAVLFVFREEAVEPLSKVLNSLQIVAFDGDDRTANLRCRARWARLLQRGADTAK